MLYWLEKLLWNTRNSQKTLTEIFVDKSQIEILHRALNIAKLLIIKKISRNYWDSLETNEVNILDFHHEKRLFYEIR